MNAILKQLMELLIRCVAAILPYNSNLRIKHWRDRLFTYRVRKIIGHMGKSVLFEKPCLLQGGGLKGLSIGEYTIINSHSVIELWSKYGEDVFEPEVKIGNHCNIGEFCHISSINKISIDDGLLTGRFVYIGDNSHGGLSLEESVIAPENRKLTSKGKIIIGKNVWIGDKATILGGVTIGDNAIIGAGTVVTHDVPPNTVVGGSKMSVLKTIVEKVKK